MCTGGESNQGPLGPKSDALSTAPLRPSWGGGVGGGGVGGGVRVDVNEELKFL